MTRPLIGPKTYADDSGAYVVKLRDSDTFRYGLTFILFGGILLWVILTIAHISSSDPWGPGNSGAEALHWAMYFILAGLAVPFGVLMLFRRYRLSFDPEREAMQATAMGLWAKSSAEFAYEDIAAVVCQVVPLRVAPYRTVQPDHGIVVCWRLGRTVVHRTRSLDDARAAARLFDERTGLTCREALNVCVMDEGIRAFAPQPLKTKMWLNRRPRSGTDPGCQVLAANDAQGPPSPGEGLPCPESERVVLGVLTAIGFSAIVVALATLHATMLRATWPDLGSWLGAWLMALGFATVVLRTARRRSLPWPGRSERPLFVIGAFLFVVGLGLSVCAQLWVML